MTQHQLIDLLESLKKLGDQEDSDVSTLIEHVKTELSNTQE
ncbi:hypothetical protein [Texcoconibacillus texcoconensis]|uniref:Uncharacterized protein n=1 Tax=Texcoconibacillus texcoconensis TaxID=1095777 RepID=A0A840QT66_9BACI|nr:hypothetical protein [Texcoconibacillus texcoconensis]MBB5174540.1 hypothetical protein [Texcoconibacillus texcoconensis]